jgi:hypothetical protein
MPVTLWSYRRKLWPSGAGRHLPMRGHESTREREF